MLSFFSRFRPNTYQQIKFSLFSSFVIVALPLFSIFNEGEFSFSRYIYVVTAIIVAASPYLFASSKSGKYLLMMVFLPIYFLLFYTNDLFALLGLSDKIYFGHEKYRGTVDKIIVIGGLMYIFGYLLIVNFIGSSWKGHYRKEWKLRSVRLWGVVFWLIGTLCFIVIWFEIRSVFIPDWSLSILSNFKKLALVGLLMIIYSYMRGKRKSDLLIISAVLIFELFLGFASNTKEVSFRGVLLFIIMQFIILGRPNLKFLVITLVCLVLYTGVFNIYRYQVVTIMDTSPKEALLNLPRTVSIIAKHLDKKSSSNKASADFVRERIDTRKYVEIIVNGLNKNVEPAKGETLKLFWLSFVPRVFWPEKPNISIGQVFNWTFDISKSSLTYIPPTHLGEFYWNYKMPGVVIGMFMIGVFMGYVSKSVDLSRQVNLPRIILLMMTIYTVCVRFEMGFAVSYSNMVRAMLILIVMNYFFVDRRTIRHGSKIRRVSG